MMKFSKHQPKDGETILHCGHLEKKPHHFYAIGDPEKRIPQEMDFRRPDGSVGKAKWMVLCRDCFQIYSDNPAACMRADGEWIGDAPVVKEDFQ